MAIDLEEIRAALDYERRHLVRRAEVAEVTTDVVRLRGEDRSWHTISWASLNEDNANFAIEAEVAHHQRLGVSFEWKVYSHDGPADLLHRLISYGFEVGPHETVMVYDLSSGGLPPATDGVTVRRVEDHREVAVFRRVAEAVFGKDYGFTAGQLLDALAAGNREHRGYVAYLGDGTPAGVGRLYTHARSLFGGLYGGGTMEAHRSRGVYRAMLGARAAEAIASAAGYLIVDALPTSRPILERLGFVRLADTWPCEWRPDVART